MTLLEWLHALSEMVGGDLPEHADLNDSLEWFGEIPEDELTAINGLGKDNPSIQAFLDLGQHLMHEMAES
jgi:hypothetical protein